MRHLRHDRFTDRLLPLAALFLLPSQAAADGGAIRLSEQQGNYRITVFSSPTPLRAGPVDISVLVQEAATGEPVSDAQVLIKVGRSGSSDATRSYPATTEAATNKLYYAANFDVPEAGWHSLEVSIGGMLGEAQVRFELEAAEPLPSWLAMWPWVAGPVLAILLFGIHQVLVRRRSVEPPAKIDFPPSG